MNTVTPYFSFPLCGAVFFVLLYLWRKGAARRATWFPLLKKAMEFGLVGLGLATLFMTFSRLGNPDVSSGSAFLLLALGFALPELLTRRKRVSVKEETKRGAIVGAAAEVARKIKTSKTPTYLEVGGIPIPVSAEPYHFLIAGSTGTGKSVAIGALLEKIRARGDTAIVVDSGGDFLAKHFQPETDFVFNPYDERCVGWSPTAEMQGVWDAQALARSIVPDGVGDSKEWNAYAQTFVASILRVLWESNRLTLRDFLYYVQAAPRKELQDLLEDTPASSQMASERTFGSIRTIAGNYVTSYDYLPVNKEQFSVSAMIRAEHSGVLFLTYRDDQLDSLRNIMACLLDVAARTILSLEPDSERRIWLIIDEFASIGRVQSIEAMATKSRKAGGCLVLGIQSVSQLKDRYGDNGAQTILSCLSTWLVLRCSDADTAEYMSKYIGEAEVRRTQKGQSSSDSGQTESWSEQSATQRVVLGSQIQALPNLSGLLKLAGDYPVCEVKLPLPPKKEAAGLPFRARDFKADPLLKLSLRAPPEVVRVPALEPAPESQPSRPNTTPATPAALAAVPVAVQLATADDEDEDESPDQAEASGPYRDKTPRPTRPPAKNLLLEVSRKQPNMAERLNLAMSRARQSREKLQRHLSALLPAEPVKGRPAVSPAARMSESPGESPAHTRDKRPVHQAQPTGSQDRNSGSRDRNSGPQDRNGPRPPRNAGPRERTDEAPQLRTSRGPKDQSAGGNASAQEPNQRQRSSGTAKGRDMLGDLLR